MNQFGVAIHVGAWKQLTDCFRYTSKCCNTYDNLKRFCKACYINISVNQSQASIYTVLILFSIGYTLAPLTACISVTRTSTNKFSICLIGMSLCFKHKSATFSQTLAETLFLTSAASSMFKYLPIS